MVFLFGGRGAENIERRRKKTGRGKTLKRKRKKNKVYNRVITGAGKAGKQVHFLVWKTGKVGVRKMFN